MTDYAGSDTAPEGFEHEEWVQYTTLYTNGGVLLVLAASLFIIGAVGYMDVLSGAVTSTEHGVTINTDQISESGSALLFSSGFLSGLVIWSYAVPVVNAAEEIRSTAQDRLDNAEVPAR